MKGPGVHAECHQHARHQKGVLVFAYVTSSAVTIDLHVVDLLKPNSSTNVSDKRRLFFLFFSLPIIIDYPVCLHCTFSEFGSVHLSLQVVP